jgi:hypothetical protein
MATRKLSITQAGPFDDERPGKRAKPHVARNSGKIEWYTPPECIVAARAVMGEIDLDPASCEVANEVVKAARIYTTQDDGLSRHWAGRVWLNPPYARGLIKRFTVKLCDHFDAGDVTEAIVLVNNGTETQWFQRLAQSAVAVVLVSKRVRYWRENDDSLSPLQGQVFVYLGSNPDRFLSVFSRFGWGLCTWPTK